MDSIKTDDVIRFNKGSHALMKVLKWDEMCGYRTYHGTHLYGEPISVSDDKIRKANKKELNLWKHFHGERCAYTRSFG